MPLYFSLPRQIAFPPTLAFRYRRHAPAFRLIDVIEMTITIRMRAARREMSVRYARGSSKS